jgi:hypothetical protein
MRQKPDGLLANDKSAATWQEEVIVSFVAGKIQPFVQMGVWPGDGHVRSRAAHFDRGNRYTAEIAPDAPLLVYRATGSFFVASVTAVYQRLVAATKLTFGKTKSAGKTLLLLYQPSELMFLKMSPKKTSKLANNVPVALAHGGLADAQFLCQVALVAVVPENLHHQPTILSVKLVQRFDEIRLPFVTQTFAKGCGAQV